MAEIDAGELLEQIQNIILNNPVEWKTEETSEAGKELQKTVSYLSRCLMESNELLKNLAEGNLEADLPDSHNFLAEDLKRLHAALKHLTWQAEQILKGDYKQRISFMGEFSCSFNEMAVQLEKRENALIEQAKRNEQMNILLKSVMDSLREWVIITENETGEILYTNEKAKKRFICFRTDNTCTEGVCPLLKALIDRGDGEKDVRYKFTCPQGRYFKVKSYPILWFDRSASVHLVTDITYLKEAEKHLSSMAYKDELTGLNNRRRCRYIINKFLKGNVPFSACMIDMDGLKKVNDQMGHLIGDEYIKCVSKAIKESVRDTDFVCRFGGDEFVVLFRSCEAEAARERLEAVNKRIAAAVPGYSSSISYGIFYAEPGRDLTPEMVLNLADERMYRFKKSRRTGFRR